MFPPEMLGQVINYGVEYRREQQRHHHLSHWLETLPAQIANWQREQQHGLFKQWSNAVEFLPEIKPYRLEDVYKRQSLYSGITHPKIR